MTPDERFAEAMRCASEYRQSAKEAIATCHRILDAWDASSRRSNFAYRMTWLSLMPVLVVLAYELSILRAWIESGL